LSKQIISKLAADTRYVDTRANGLPSVPHSVVVRGPRRGRPVVTEVSDADAAFLAAHPHFAEHAARGFVKIVEAS
jgi:hypothetical protein